MKLLPAVIAHRGASFHCHENTISSFQRAMDDGADGIEFDLRVTMDRQWVVHHDAECLRLGKRVKLATHLGSDVAIVTVGLTADPIPTLDTFLNWADQTGPSLIFDIKDTRQIDALIETVERHKLMVPMVFSSFRKSVLQEIKRARPSWHTALIVGNPRSRLARRMLLRTLLRWSRRNDLSALHLHERWITPGIVKVIHDAGLRLAVWTVDDPRRMALLAALGVDSIITNRPDVGRSAMVRMNGDVVTVRSSRDSGNL